MECMPDFIFVKIGKVVWGVLLGCFIAVGYVFWELPDSRMHIYFLNVGQGDAIFIESPEGHQVLIDGGPGNDVLLELDKVLGFFDRSIDMLVLTHPDYDHVAGLVEVLKRFEVERVLMTGVEMESGTYDEFLKELAGVGEIYFAEAEVDFVFGDLVMDVIYPFKNISGERFENVNNSSIALRVLYDEFVVLLTGDLEIEKEALLINAGVDLDADIYKAGHHGSRSSSTLGFLQMIKAETIVVQSGADNKFGHPHPEVLRRFYRNAVERVLRNDLNGLIEIVF